MRDADIERAVRKDIKSIVRVENYRLRLSLIEDIGFDRLYQEFDLEPLELDDLIVDCSIRDLGIKFTLQVAIVDAYICKSKNLSLASSEINVLSTHLGKLTQLNHLELSGNNFDILPDTLFNLNNLVYLDLSWNQLAILPDTFDLLSNLEYLNLHGNPISDLSPLQQLPERTQVNFINETLSRRYWTKLSEWRSQWLMDETDYELRMKLIREIGLTQIFHDLKLKPLILDDLKIQDPYEEFDESIFNSDELYHYEYPSDEMPEVIDDLQLLDNNKIYLDSEEVYYDDYPAEIYTDGERDLYYKAKIANAYISRQKHLSLNCGSIKILSASLGMLSELTTLNLSANLLTELPNTIGKISKIESLNLSENRFQNIPYIIVELSHLKHLDLNNNQIKNFPAIVDKLSRLEHLDLSNNQISTIPKNISNLSRLKYLVLTNNPIIDLSPLQELSVQVQVRFFGILLSRRYWRKFSEWEPQWLLDEDNVEIRRTLIQQVGYDRICQELKAEEINIWREYTLLKIDIAERVYDWERDEIAIEPLLLLKMTCPSTGHIHILRVPPAMTKAEDAIVWVNHGIHPDRFAIQT